MAGPVAGIETAAPPPADWPPAPSVQQDLQGVGREQPGGGVLLKELLPPALSPSCPLLVLSLCLWAPGCGRWCWAAGACPGWGMGHQQALQGPLPCPLHGCICLFPLQGEGLHQLREALKILAERVLILETMIGLYGE